MITHEKSLQVLISGKVFILTMMKSLVLFNKIGILLVPVRNLQGRLPGRYSKQAPVTTKRRVGPATLVAGELCPGYKYNFLWTRNDHAHTQLVTSSVCPSLTNVRHLSWKVLCVLEVIHKTETELSWLVNTVIKNSEEMNSYIVGVHYKKSWGNAKLTSLEKVHPKMSFINRIIQSLKSDLTV